MRALFCILMICLFLPVPAVPIDQISYTGELNVQSPVAITADIQGRIYIAQQQGTIRIIDKSLATVKTIGGTDNPWPELLVSPAGLCLHNDYLYVTDASLDRIAVLTRNGDFVECYGKRGKGPGEFNDPSDIFISQGIIYVADTGNNRIQMFGENGVFLHEFGSSENKSASLEKPFQVEVDSTGRIYAADKSGLIKIFDSAGRYLQTIPGLPQISAFGLNNEGLLVANKAQCAIEKYAFDFKKNFAFGNRGEGRGQFKSISALLPADDGKIYVADVEGNRVQIFSPDGRQNRETVYPSAAPPTSALWTRIITTERNRHISRMVYDDDTIYTITDGESAIGVLKNGQPMKSIPLSGFKPEAAASDSQRNLYVLSSQGSVAKLNRSGKIEFTFNTGSSKSGELGGRRNSLAVSRDGIIYITDRINKKINVFNADGLFIRAFEIKEPGRPPLDPMAAAVDETGRLFLLDGANKSVAVFSPEGESVGRFPTGDKTDDPVDMAISDGNIFVLDGKGSHVKVFSTNGDRVARFGAAGEGAGSLGNPDAIAGMNRKQFLVYERDNSRIQEFSMRYTPPPPENTTAIGGARTILIQWDKNADPGIVEYVIYRADRDNQRPTRLAQTAKRSYVDETVSPGVNYYYRITARTEDGGESVMTPPVTAAAKEFAVPAPSGLKAFPKDISVQLAWEPASCQHLANYTVYSGEEKIAATTETQITVDELLAETDYTFSVTAVSTDKIESSPSTISVRTLPTTRPPVEIEVIELSDVFSNTYKSYEQYGIGKLIVRNNTSEHIAKMSILFSIKNFMDFPSETAVTDLTPGKHREILLKAVLNDNILNVSEDSPVQTEIAASYYLRGELKKFSIKQTINVYEKHKMRWNDPQRIGAFVTTKDPLVLELVRNVITQYKYTTDPLVSACVIFDALGAAGISYVTDPSNSYQETKDNTELVDYLQYPRETIRRRSGDCDDLAILYAAALESIGTRTKFVEVPGHIFLMFQIGDAGQVGRDTMHDLLIIEENGGVWVPIETTRIGSSFTDAWESGSRKYYQGRGNALSTIDVRQTWSKYKPASLPTTAAEPIRIARTKIDETFKNEFDVIRRTSIKIQHGDYFTRLEKNPEDAEARLQLGIAYARYGILEEASQLFDRALRSMPANASLLNNAANILFMNKQYDKAIEIYRKAIEADPKDGYVRINLVKALLETGEKQEARKEFQDACRVNPDIANEFRSLALKLPGPG